MRTVERLKNVFNQPDTPTLNAFFRSAADGDIVGVAQFLNKYPFCIDDGNGVYGTTALMYAASLGKKNVVYLLLERGATLDKKDKKGWTALQYAEAAHQNDSDAIAAEIAEMLRRQKKHGMVEKFKRRF